MYCSCLIVSIVDPLKKFCGIVVGINLAAILLYALAVSSSSSSSIINLLITTTTTTPLACALAVSGSRSLDNCLVVHNMHGGWNSEEMRVVVHLFYPKTATEERDFAVPIEYYSMMVLLLCLLRRREEYYLSFCWFGNANVATVLAMMTINCLPC